MNAFASIRAKLILFGVMVIVIVAGLGGLAIFQLASVRGNVVNLATNWLPSVSNSSALNTSSSDFRVAEGLHLMSTDQAGMKKAEDEMAVVSAKIAESRKIYEPLISSDEERKIYEKFSAEWATYLQMHAKLIELSHTDKEAASTYFRGEMRPIFDSASKRLDDIVDINTKGAQEDYAKSESSYALTLKIVEGTILLAIMAIGFVLYGVTRGIIKSLKELSRVISALAALDLSIEAVITNKDEIGLVLGQFNTSNASYAAW